jgi:uncharacterized peroxidase-related enzyme
MLTYKIYNEETASEDLKKTLASYTQKYGFIPNVMGVAAESGAALKAYTFAVGALENSTLTPVELQALYLAISYENGCKYCVAAHTTVSQMLQLDEKSIKDLRVGEDVDDFKLNELIRFARINLRERGRVSKGDIERFIEAGYTKGNIFDVITLIATKTISNYINHIVETPVDDAFKKNIWEGK